MALHNSSKYMVQACPIGRVDLAAKILLRPAAAALAAGWQWLSATAELVVERGQNGDLVKLHSCENCAPVVTLV